MKMLQAGIMQIGIIQVSGTQNTLVKKVKFENINSIIFNTNRGPHM